MDWPKPKRIPEAQSNGVTPTDAADCNSMKTKYHRIKAKGNAELALGFY